ncbi:MAG TPA: class I SAM-dependent methyltransferase, partial [bacterium]|nr:class I SAM-dependent methyltransferase [bacterium]
WGVRRAWQRAHLRYGKAAPLSEALPPAESGPPPALLTSMACRQAFFDAAFYAPWCAAMKQAPLYRRKQWEWVFIAQALEERGLLAPGRRGLGFGVGMEPLTALFAQRGCQITATDLPAQVAQAQGWAYSGEHASGLRALNHRRLCPPQEFAQRVMLRAVDMNHIPADLAGYDFCWSSCALEHLGSLEAGLAFIRNSLDCLRPGGLAVHTTELNLSPGTETAGSGPTVLYRREHLEGLAARLRAAGHRVAPLDFDTGHLWVDGHVDVPPYRREPHLKLVIGQFVSTSFGLIVEK